MPVKTRSNELVILENGHFARKIFSERVDRQPPNRNPRNHQAKAAQRNELFTVLYVSYPGEPYDDTDDADQMGDIPKFG